MSERSPSAERLLADASAKLAWFEEIIRGVSYEDRGVLFSEILFVAAALGETVPTRILESGRARGQSTLLFARCFPNSEIISIDCEPGTPDAAAAEERLKPCANVQLLYGDSRERLPELMRSGDLVFIDGPKGFRAVRLALALLRSPQSPRAVFLHDVYRGLPEREFLEGRLDTALFSDERAFVERFARLDQVCWETIRAQEMNGWQPYHFEGSKQESYGPTVGYIPGGGAGIRWSLAFELALQETVTRFRRSLAKRVG